MTRAGASVSFKPVPRTTTKGTVAGGAFWGRPGTGTYRPV
jgi:hypothetical protein